MTPSVVALAVAYAGVAALLLHLCLATPYPARVKLGAVLVASALYVVTWHGTKGLLGWASAEPLPDAFRLHWVTVDEPDKRLGTDGVIFFWIRALDEAGLPVGEPRAYRLPWDEETAEAAERALSELAQGEPINGRRSRQILNPGERPEEERPRYQDGGGAAPGPRPLLEFERVPPPSLPPKAPPPG